MIAQKDLGTFVCQQCEQPKPRKTATQVVCGLCRSKGKSLAPYLAPDQQISDALALELSLEGTPAHDDGGLEVQLAAARLKAAKLAAFIGRRRLPDDSAEGGTRRGRPSTASLANNRKSFAAIGNSVCPPMAAAMVQANCGFLKAKPRRAAR